MITREHRVAVEVGYSPRAWRETMRELGGHAERVGLALAQLADDQGRIPRPYTGGLAARAGLRKQDARNGANTLRLAGALEHGEGYAMLVPSLTAQRTPGRPDLDSVHSVPMVHRFDSDAGTWCEPVTVSEYIARRLAPRKAGA